MNHYEREQKLFTLLVDAIEKENPNPDEGIENLLNVLRVHVSILGGYSEGRNLSVADYLAALQAGCDCGEMIEALLTNHTQDVKEEESQAGRMMSLLVDLRHDLESTAWEFEERHPEAKDELKEFRHIIYTQD
jgi:hypothetical protein